MSWGNGRPSCYYYLCVVSSCKQFVSKISAESFFYSYRQSHLVNSIITIDTKGDKMKKVIVTVLLVALLVSIMSAGCGLTITGSGNLETETFDFMILPKLRPSMASRWN